MLFGSLTNIFIAVAVTFASTALLVSTVVEAIASGLKWRADNLMDGLKTVMNATTPSHPSAFDWLIHPFNNRLPPRPAAQTAPAAPVMPAAAAVPVVPAAPAARPVAEQNALRLYHLLEHAAINPRGPGGGAPPAGMAATPTQANPPSYIPPRQFALALLDVLQTGDGSQSLSLKQAIEEIGDPQLRQYLSGVYRRAAGDAVKMRAEIADWFDSTMDRIGGVYKRHTQLWTVLIGYALAALFNIDALKIIHVALTNPALVDNVAANFSTTDALGNLQKIRTPAVLAVGWSFAGDQGVWDMMRAKWDLAAGHPGLLLLKLTGWAVTAIAALFGAPFWFDTLQRFVSLRGTGDPPAAP